MFLCDQFVNVFLFQVHRERQTLKFCYSRFRARCERTTRNRTCLVKGKWSEISTGRGTSYRKGGTRARACFARGTHQVRLIPSFCWNFKFASSLDRILLFLYLTFVGNKLISNLFISEEKRREICYLYRYTFEYFKSYVCLSCYVAT